MVFLQVWHDKDPQKSPNNGFRYVLPFSPFMFCYMFPKLTYGKLDAYIRLGITNHAFWP